MAVQVGRSLESRILKGAIWSGVNTLLMKFANIAVMVFVVRIVTPQDFGVFAVALVVHAVVSSIGEMGLSSCISRRDLEPDEVAPTVALLSIVSSSTLAAAMYFFSEQLAALLGSAEAYTAIQILSLSVFLGGIFTVPGALLVRDFQQNKIFLAGAIAFVPMNAVLILLASTGSGATAFAWSRVAGQLISGMVMMALTTRKYFPSLNLTQVKHILSFGTPLAGANLLSYILLNADYALVSRSLGPTELGIYMLAFNVASWPTSILSSTINSVAMPAFSARQSTQEQTRLMANRAFSLVALMALPIGAMSVGLAYPLIRVLYGEKWLAAAPVLSILAIYGAVFSTTLLMSNLLVATGRSKAIIGVQTIWIATLVPAILLAVSFSGLIGVAIAHVVIIIAIVLPTYVIFIRPLLPQCAALISTTMRIPLAASIIGGTLAAGISELCGAHLAGLLAGGLLGTAVYSVLVLPFARRLLPQKPRGKAKLLIETYDLLSRRMRLKLPSTGG